MKILSSDITLLHGRTTGIAALPDEATDQPLLVFVHGGGATSRSFDIPGHSQILRAARNGFPAYALDRPGYGGSEPLGLPADSDTGVLRAAAERLDQAVTELWQRHATTAPGVVVIGCSIGGAVATHLAALWSDQERPGWPLLGLALVDIGQLPPENVVDAWRSTPAEERIDMSELRGRITAPPLWTLAPISSACTACRASWNPSYGPRGWRSSAAGRGSGGTSPRGSPCPSTTGWGVRHTVDRPS